MRAHLLRRVLLGCLLAVGGPVGCDGVLILTFAAVPAQTSSIQLSVTLRNNGSLDSQPQEDVIIRGGFSEAIGLRYPAGEVATARVTATALTGGGMCLARDMETVEFAGPGKHYVTIDFGMSGGCQ